MNELEKMQQLHKEGLSKSHFFEHLLMVMEEKKLISEQQCQELQLGLIHLLSCQIEKYNNGQSSSIPKQKAEALMASIYYTLGVYFRSLDNIDDGIEMLQQGQLDKAFEEGRKLIWQKVALCQQLYNRLQNERVEIANIAYEHTFKEGLKPFFNSYDPVFMSHQLEADIDYPLCLDQMEEIGVSYMESYLSKALIENDFCRCFDQQEIEEILEDYHKGYKHLLLNIFERVLMNAIGNVFLEKEGLRLEEEEGQLLYEKLQPLEGTDLKLCFMQAARKLMEDFNLTDEAHKRYIYAAVCKWVPIAVRSLNDHDLTELFAVRRQQEETELSLAGGSRLSDEAFKGLTEEIRALDQTEEKLAVIRQNITSAEDLRDVLEADCIFDEEFAELFTNLSDMELAVLIRFNMMDEFGTIDLEEDSGQDKAWYTAMRRYLAGLDDGHRQIILHLAEHIKMGNV